MNDDRRDRIGTLVTTGIPGPELDADTRRALVRLAPSGVILFRRNVESVDQLARLVADLHALPSRPMVSIDHEGEPVTRLGPPFTIFPAAERIGRSGAPDLAFTVGHAMGLELASVGIDIDFAPVLDVHSNPQNPIIGQRAFASRADEVARLAVAFMRGLHCGGVLSCGKHFPGHGDTDRDSHTELPVVTRSREELEATELAPFRAAVAANVPMLMTAHVVYPALDGRCPATLSRAILHDLLRNEIGFQGVVVSDDLEMKAISAAGAVREAAIEALRAGVDWLLVGNDLDEALGIAERIARALDRGELKEEELWLSRNRIRSLSVPPRATPAVVLPVGEHERLNRHLRERSRVA